MRVQSNGLSVRKKPYRLIMTLQPIWQVCSYKVCTWAFEREVFVTDPLILGNKKARALVGDACHFCRGAPRFARRGKERAPPSLPRKYLVSKGTEGQPQKTGSSPIYAKKRAASRRMISRHERYCDGFGLRRPVFQ